MFRCLCRFSTSNFQIHSPFTVTTTVSPSVCLMKLCSAKGQRADRLGWSVLPCTTTALQSGQLLFPSSQGKTQPV